MTTITVADYSSNNIVPNESLNSHYINDSIADNIQLTVMDDDPAVNDVSLSTTSVNNNLTMQ